ncbi:hypothetical protein [Nostoc sp.]|uniref:hypothetical protein n=1 Tax=Nostoc sp. TaxID=1180 RepID=UPI002FF98688
MTQKAAITEAITTLQDAENRFCFVRVEDQQFFPEWYEGLSEITEAEKSLDSHSFIKIIALALLFYLLVTQTICVNPKQT